MLSITCGSLVFSSARSPLPPTASTAAPMSRNMSSFIVSSVWWGIVGYCGFPFWRLSKWVILVRNCVGQRITVCNVNFDFLLWNGWWGNGGVDASTQLTNEEKELRDGFAVKKWIKPTNIHEINYMHVR
jgi:hypothetical protein